jgi:hypothetical protein
MSPLGTKAFLTSCSGLLSLFGGMSAQSFSVGYRSLISVAK